MKIHFIFLPCTAICLLAACLPQTGAIASTDTGTASKHDIAAATQDFAIFAGGCFWCVEADFDKVHGVTGTVSGYIGGKVVNPTYEQVSQGQTGHIEAVKVYYDSTKTNYARLLAAFWPMIDPLASNRQFCDMGSQYRSAIFYANEEQRQQAQASLAALDDSGRFSLPVVTELLPVTMFYPAEEYHQDYYLKNPLRYRFYRSRCGRDQRLTELWGQHRK
ncbi:MAG: peptide-methionine (S)-S-oxide reductase MsrA [Nitrosomonas sp.]|nr:peptide-methionine (S)-S-oxide reductase MsrA [Nitrosomonas sp.]